MATVIKSLSTSAGYLERSPLEFSSGLNCIIGARGTCKSTVVETIRFLFDCDRERIELLIAKPSGTDTEDSPSSNGLVRATLKDATAKCSVLHNRNGAETETLLIERSIDSPARVYKEGIQEVGTAEVLAQIEKLFLQTFFGSGLPSGVNSSEAELRQ